MEAVADYEKSELITRNKMSPTSIGGGGEYHNRRELISPASLKGRVEDLPATNLEQWPYKRRDL